MEIPLIITDVTRMNGTRVCVAGITEDGLSVRPTLPNPGIQEEWLYTNEQCVIRPFSRVKLDFLHQQQPKPPHTEDWEINPAVKDFSRILNTQEQNDLLRKITFPKVSDIFEAQIYTGVGNYTLEGEGVRSLGTIKVRSIDFVKYGPSNFGIEYSIKFHDEADLEYKLTVTDLTFRYYVEYLNKIKGLSFNSIGLKLQRFLNKGETYLRIGLARNWDIHPNLCHLQINGVYSFPDYLEGRCFADFKPT